MLERLKNWKTTLMGVAGAGAIVVIFKSFGCELPSDWIVWGMATIPAAIGALGKD